MSRRKRTRPAATGAKAQAQGKPKTSLDSPAGWFINALAGHKSLSNIEVTPLTALGVGTVYACVNLVARTIATLPLKLMRRRPDGGREPAIDHPLYDLLHAAPNEEMTSAEFRIAMQGHLSLRNNSYAIVERSMQGDVLSLVPAHPAEVIPFRDGNERLFYRYKGTAYQANDVLHLRTYSQNGLVGADLISVVGNVIGLAIALEQNAMSFFGNSSRPGLVFEAPTKLSDEAFSRLQTALEENHTGVEQAYKALILEEGLKTAQIRSDNKDSQFDESRDRQDRAIARVFGVPPHKVGVINAEPRANVEEQNLEFATDTIGSTVVFWEQALNKTLLSPSERKEYFFHFSLEGLLRGNIKDRFEAFSKARQWGWLSVDEIREKENLNPLPDGKGKIYLQPLNMVEAGTPPEPAEPAEPAEPGELTGSADTRSRVDAYGIAVRSGAVTPQLSDEESFRAEMGLPPMGPEAKEAWQRDKGTRRPITLATPKDVEEGAAEPAEPAEPEGDEPATE